MIFIIIFKFEVKIFLYKWLTSLADYCYCGKYFSIIQTHMNAINQAGPINID